MEKETRVDFHKTAIGGLIGVFSFAFPAHASSELDRYSLPIAEPKIPPYTELDARNAKPPARFLVKAPEGAPNVIIVLIDDMGFGQSSAFGGPIQMPTLDKMAINGIRYNRFHTTALCSPTRTALLTGRNHHVNNMGTITESATAFPGNTGVRPNSVAPLAQILRLNGYSTAAFGKYHETPAWEVSASGPTDRWPTRSGFDKFYGFIGAEANQYAPGLYDGLARIEAPKTPGYHLMTDLSNQAIAWLKSEKALTPNKPIFMYFAPGATHAPHQVPKEWIAKYKGKFDMGWDKLREQTLARQKELGIVPANTTLASKPEAIRDWDKLSLEEQRLFARQMEVFAAFGEYTDFEIGRVTQALADMGQIDNTLIFYIVGDNGASAEGGMNGMFNENTFFNGHPETVAEVFKHIDDLGGPNAYNHYAAGWAVAGDTPFRWTKQIAGSFGGTRNGMVVSWPKRIKAKNEIRSQFHHVIDVAPTVLEAASIPQPKSVNGTPQTPIQGVSMLYTFDDAKAKERHVTQYFEITGNRGIYHKGWLAGTVHRAPWEYKPRRPLLEDKWELYNVNADFSLSNDLSTQNPEKLKELQNVFLEEAVENKVLPLDDRAMERLNPALAGRPDLMAGRTALTVFPGMVGMSENVFINTKNQSHSVTANLEIPKTNVKGVVIAQAGRFGGWSLFLKGGKPVYVYNYLGMNEYKIASKQVLPVGKVSLRYEFTYDGGGLGKGGTGRLFVNDTQVAQGRIEKTMPMLMSVDEGVDVGQDGETNVTNEYKEQDNAFTGKIVDVSVKLSSRMRSRPPTKRKKKGKRRRIAWIEDVFFHQIFVIGNFYCWRSR